MYIISNFGRPISALFGSRILIKIFIDVFVKQKFDFFSYKIVQLLINLDPCPDLPTRLDPVPDSVHIFRKTALM
jgi:hypothetical protein